MKNKTYYIMSKVEIQCSININAKNLEEAISKARELDVTDFVEIKDEYIDGELKITGVYE